MEPANASGKTRADILGICTIHDADVIGAGIVPA